MIIPPPPSLSSPFSFAPSSPLLKVLARPAPTVGLSADSESGAQFKCGPFLLNSNVPHYYNYFCWKIKNKVSSGKLISKAVCPWIRRGAEPEKTLKKKKENLWAEGAFESMENS